MSNEEEQDLKPQLTLLEEVLLLVLRDRDGKVDWKAGYFQTVLAGAIISELILGKYVKIGASGKKLLHVPGSGSTGNMILNDARHLIHEAKNPKSLQSWISKLSNLPGLKERVAKGLCAKGILRETEDKVMMFFTRKRYPEVNHEPEKEVISRLQKAITTEQEDVDVRTALLISLTYKSGILQIPFPYRDLRLYKTRIKRIINGEAVGKATSEVIECIQAAIIVATVVPVIVTQ